MVPLMPLILAAYLAFGIFWVPYKIIQAIVRENKRRKVRRPNNLGTKGQAKATSLRVWKDYVEWAWDGKRWNRIPNRQSRCMQAGGFSGAATGGCHSPK